MTRLTDISAPSLRTGRLLRLVRIVVSVSFLILISALFAWGNANVAVSLQWTAKIQIVPLIISSSATALAVWIIVTLIFGRVYCSTICPTGTLQDIFARLRRHNRHILYKRPYHYSAPNNPLRYTVLGIIALTFALGAAMLLSLLDPYSAYGRIASELLAPVMQWISGNEIVIGSVSGIIVAVLTLLLTGIAAWVQGRVLCNTICPVGTLLSIFSRWSLFHFDIDTDTCINCRKCEHVCKAHCINLNDHVVDSSRCVVCFDCTDICPEGAIRYTSRRKKLSIPMLQRIQSAAPTASVAKIQKASTDAQVPEASAQTGMTAPARSTDVPVRIDRRAFIATGLILAATPIAKLFAEASVMAGDRYPIKPEHPVMPPGRRSMADFLHRCTGCGLCVSHCPTHILRPAYNQLGLQNMLHPVMDYDRGACLYDCTLCTQLCPTSALTPLTSEEKHIFIIGHARVAPENCIGCGACSAACPRHAISMKMRPAQGPGYRGSRSHRIACVDTTLCIGCGACQDVCPGRPYKAIIIDGII